MKQKDSNLIEYELTDEEILRGSVLTSLQIAIYRNEIARLTKMYITIKYDVLNPLVTMREQIAFQSQIAIYESLIDAHTSAVDLINNRSSGE